MMSLMRKRACDRCHRLKQQCNGSTSCESCQKSNVVCTYDRPVNTIGRPRIKQTRSPNKGAQNSGRRKYSHNGCNNCKRIKKKCDELLPTCSYCRKNHLKCVRKAPSSWLKCEVKNSWDKQALPSQHIFDTREKEESFLNILIKDTASHDSQWKGLDQLKSMDSIQPMPLELNNKERIFLSTLVNSPYTNDLKPSPGLLPDVDQDNTSEVTRGHDNSSPSFSLSSEVEEMQVFEDKKLHLLRLCELPEFQESMLEIELLRYFITDVSPLLFVDKTSTRFLSTIVPLSVKDKRIRYPIIAIAASHRSKSFSTQISEYQRDYTLYRAKAQSVFICESADSYLDTEIVLLSILLIAVQEVFDGTSLYWCMAIERAAGFIHMKGGIKEVSKTSPLAIQLFCYLDLITSLSTCSTPFLEFETAFDSSIAYDSLEEKYIENLLNSKFGFKFGIGGELYKIIGNLATLAGLRTTRFKTKAHEQRFNSFADFIELKLQDWSPPVDFVAVKYEIDQKDSIGKIMISSYTLALQWSAFLRLHQIRFGYDRKNSRVRACSDIIMKSIKAIDSRSPLETGLLFPLVMVGSVAYEDDDRKYIISRVRSIQSKLKFKYVEEFEKLLREVWSKDDEEGDEVNWAKIRYYQFLGLVMF